MSLATEHGSVVSVFGHGLLIYGASGAGKSSLVLAMLQRDPQAQLVADDRVILWTDNGRLYGRAPEALFGLLEVWGVGLMQLPALAEVQITRVVHLVPASALQRLPERKVTSICGVDVPSLDAPADGPTQAAAMAEAWLRYDLSAHS